MRASTGWSNYITKAGQNGESKRIERILTMNVKRKKGFFSISAVAKMFSIHQQTIRLYEKEGLISPKRSAGNTRLFSEEDINRLDEVIHLTHELGINLAGVEMILKLKKQISSMQKEMNKLFDSTNEQLDAQTDLSKQRLKANMEQLRAIKKNVPTTTEKQTKQTMPDESEEHILDIDDWDVEYDQEK